MIHAYREIYLCKARSVLGDAFEYAINRCAIPGGEFVKLFLSSQISRRMENGEPACIAGMSGAELVIEIIAETKGGEEITAVPEESFGRSAEYWIGWALAHYQWYSGRRYSEIFSAVSFDELERLYPVLHEADVSKFCDIIDSRIREVFPDTNLKRYRSLFGYTQSELARESGVSLRSIQMYEERYKDINKASATTLLALSRAFGCSMEDLVEK